MFQKMAVVFLGVACIQLVAMDESKSNIQKVHDNKDWLFETKSSLPPAVVGKVQKFLVNNHALVDNVIVNSKMATILAVVDVQQRKDLYMAFSESQKTILEQAGIANKSANNFALDMGGYYIKTSGLINRWNNYLVSLGQHEGTWLKYFEEQFKGGITPSTRAKAVEWLVKKPTTYQAISSAAWYQLIKLVIEQYNLSVAVPLTALVHVPGRPENLSDQNYVVVQEALEKDFVPLHEQKDLCKTLSKEQVVQACTLIKEAKLWDAAKSLRWSKEKQMFGITDLEQPNNSAVQHFFLQDKGHADHMVNVGLGKSEWDRGFAHVLKDAGANDQYAWVSEYIQSQSK